MADRDDNQALTALAGRIRQGDRDALGELLLIEQARLYNVILRMVAHRDDALELTQQSMLQAIEHIDSFKGHSAISTWITRIAMNAALSHLRKRRVRRTSSLDAPGFSAAGRATSRDDQDDGPTRAGQLADHREPSPDSRIEREEEAQLLVAALAAVEDDHRAVLVLRDIDGLDYQRMAEILDIAVGTVKSRLFRARLALRTEVAKLEDPNHQPASPSQTMNDPQQPKAAESHHG